jgi:hypothetical protein
MDKTKDHKSGSIVPVLACVLNQLCVSNDQMPFSPKESNSKFHALRIPFINLRDYLERIAKYSGCSSECLVLALVYIDRIIQGSQNFIVNSYCIHRLLITSVMLAAKFFDDHYYNNAYYAKVGGVTYSEMNALEVEFLFMLNFDLFVTTETYKQYYDELWSHANSTPAHLCGCINAKVPLLILPRFDEPRKTPPTMLADDSDLIDQSDLDIIEDDPPLSPTLGIPTLSTRCGKIPSIDMTSTTAQPQPHPSGLRSALPELQPTTTSRPVSASIPIPPPSKRVSPDISNPTWHVSPSVVKHDRIIAPPPLNNNKPSGGPPLHELKNPAPFSGSNPFFPDHHSSHQLQVQQLQPSQQQPLPQLPVAYEEIPNLFSSSGKATVSNQLGTAPGRDDVMLDIIIDHTMAPRPITPTLIGQQGGSRHSVTSSHGIPSIDMIVESPSITSRVPTLYATSAGRGAGVGFYGDFSSFLSNTDPFDERVIEGGEEMEGTLMMDSKLYEISPTFHPYRTNHHHTQNFIPSSSQLRRSGGLERNNLWSTTTSRSHHRLPAYPSHPQVMGHLTYNTSSKRKNSSRGDSALWQSIVLPVY